MEESSFREPLRPSVRVCVDKDVSGVVCRCGGNTFVKLRVFFKEYLGRNGSALRDGGRRGFVDTA